MRLAAAIVAVLVTLIFSALAVFSVAAASPGDKGAAAAMRSDPLKAVAFIPGTSHVRVSFALPPSMVPFAIHFDLKAGTRSIEGSHETFFALPGIRKGNENNDPSNAPLNFGVTTTTTWTSEPITGVNLRAPRGRDVVWNVRLDYAPRAMCRRVGRCAGIRHSRTLTFRAGSNPGIFTDASDGSGHHPSTRTGGPISNDASTVIVRAGSIPNGQNVHLDWQVTCTRGSTVKKTSGGWDDTTPVDDGHHVKVPRWHPSSGNPNSWECYILMRASLPDGSGGVSLSIFSWPPYRYR
jgi:hypothetical protein